MFVFDADGGHVVAPSSQFNVQPVVSSSRLPFKQCT